MKTSFPNNEKKFPLPEAGYTQESPADRWANMETQTTIHIWSAGGSTHMQTSQGKFEPATF